MPNLLPVYTASLKEFENLTNTQAVTLKNKGKEEGVKKLKLLFKNGKTIDQRLADFDKAVNDSEAGGNKAPPEKKLEAVKVAYEKLNEGLKKNIEEYKAQERVLGPDEQALKVGCGVFVNRLEAIRKQAKSTFETRAKMLITNKSGEEKLRGELRLVYLNMSKGIAETQALMKGFIAKPTEDKLEATFGSATGPRSIGAAVTYYKQMVLKQMPDANDRIGADPEHLLLKIHELTQRKAVSHWKQVFGHPAPTWEQKAVATARMCLDQMNNWTIMASKIKDLAR